jgi:hypothetical protein
VDLHEPVYGAAPGQTACLLEGDRVLGFGTIMKGGAPEHAGGCVANGSA